MTRLRAVLVALIAGLTPLLGLGAQPVAAAPAAPLELSPASGPAGTQITASDSECSSSGSLAFNRGDGSTVVATPYTPPSTSFIVPNESPGIYSVVLSCADLTATRTFEITSVQQEETLPPAQVVVGNANFTG
jgi:hypothetical protein